MSDVKPWEPVAYERVRRDGCSAFTWSCEGVSEAEFAVTQMPSWARAVKFTPANGQIVIVRPRNKNGGGE